MSSYHKCYFSSYALCNILLSSPFIIIIIIIVNLSIYIYVFPFHIYEFSKTPVSLSLYDRVYNYVNSRQKGAVFLDEFKKVNLIQS